MLKHAKISAAADPVDPDLVGGPDWNAAHVIADGTLTPIGIMQVAFDGYGGGFDSSIRSSRFGALVKDTTGMFHFSVSLTGLAYEPGATLAFFFDVSFSGGGLPAGWSVNVVYSGSGPAEVFVKNAGASFADFTDAKVMNITLYVEPT